MEPEDMTVSKNKVLGLGIVSLAIITVVLLGIVFFARNRVAQSRKTVTVPTADKTASNSPRMSTLNGKMGLSLKGATGSYKKGDTVVIFVYADTKESKITGYDAVLQFDPKVLTYDSVNSDLEGMEVVATETDIESVPHELIITGIRSISKKDPFVLSNTALVEVHFTVIGAGPTEVKLAYEPGGTDDSNLMTAQNQDIISSVEGTTVPIR